MMLEVQSEAPGTRVGEERNPYPYRIAAPELDAEGFPGLLGQVPWQVSSGEPSALSRCSLQDPESQDNVGP